MWIRWNLNGILKQMFWMFLYCWSNWRNMSLWCSMQLFCVVDVYHGFYQLVLSTFWSFYWVGDIFITRIEPSSWVKECSCQWCSCDTCGGAGTAIGRPWSSQPWSEWVWPQRRGSERLSYRSSWSSGGPAYSTLRAEGKSENSAG